MNLQAHLNHRPGLVRQMPMLDPAMLDALERNARAMRSRALSDLFQRFGDWLGQVAWRARQRDLANYLSQATDHADLERRMRALHFAGG